MKVQITPTHNDPHNWGYRGASLIDRRLIAVTDQARVKVEYNFDAISDGQVPTVTAYSGENLVGVDYDEENNTARMLVTTDTILRVEASFPDGQRFEHCLTVLGSGCACDEEEASVIIVPDCIVGLLGHVSVSGENAVGIVGTCPKSPLIHAVI